MPGGHVLALVPGEGQALHDALQGHLHVLCLDKVGLERRPQMSLGRVSVDIRDLNEERDNGLVLQELLHLCKKEIFLPRRTP